MRGKEKPECYRFKLVFSYRWHANRRSVGLLEMRQDGKAVKIGSTQTRLSVGNLVRAANDSRLRRGCGGGRESLSFSSE